MRPIEIWRASGILIFGRTPRKEFYFRQVLDLAAQSNGLKWQVFSDRNFDDAMAERLGAQYARVKRTISELGRSIPPPWRADEKQAAMAAWFVLSGL